MRIKSYIPNTITCMSLIAGCMAIFLSFRSSEVIGSLLGYQWAFVCLAAAALFDFCDGAAARALDSYSDMGKELDSLCDLVSFGIAPCMLIYNTLLAVGSAPWIAWCAIIIPVFGALRLAKFNIDDRQTTSFRGLPIPANAIFWIGACAWIRTYGYFGDILMLVLMVAVSALMVSELPMFSLKFHNFKLAENFRRYLILVSAVVFVIACGVPGFAWTIILYVALSLLGNQKQA